MYLIFTIFELFLFISSLSLVQVLHSGVIKRDEFILVSSILSISVILSSLFVGKYKFLKNKNFSISKQKLLIALMLNLIILISLYFLHRIETRLKIQLMLGLFLGYFTEMIYLILKDWKSVMSLLKKNLSFISLWIFVLDLILISGLFYLRFVKRFDYNFDKDFFVIGASTIYFAWFSGGIVWHHFSSKIEHSYLIYLWQYIKNYIYMILIVIFLGISFSLPNNLFISLMSVTLFYVFGSFLFFTFRFFRNIPSKEDINRLKFIRATDITHADTIGELLFKGSLYSINGKAEEFAPLIKKLKEIYLNKFPRIFEFLNSRLNLNSFDVTKSVVLRSKDQFNVDIIPDGSLQFFMNLHQLNDIRRINAYLISVNKKLVSGGVLVCCFQSTSQRYSYIFKKYPYFLAVVIYFIDFIWNRVFPKLPLLQKIYFQITKGMNRALPLAEMLGRLVYCGFNFVDFREINNLTYIIAFKVREPLEDSNPSYGPFFKMKRIGKDAKEIYVYKLRTMHPYSEYIQSLIYELFNVKEGGKLKNDFRVTFWGKILRKIWVDELPMLINFFKGDLKLVGVRPLSKHYFSLYPDDLKEMRVKTKPGLVPPFYYDLPKTMEEIFESERKYLKKYFQNPLKTDVEYFIKCMYNILIKNARSQ